MQLSATMRRRALPALFLGLVALLVLWRTGEPGAADENRVELLFASTRQVSGEDDPARFLGPEHGPLVYGSCTVSYEQSPRAGRWSGYRDYFVPGDSREVVAAGTVDEEDFMEALTGAEAPVQTVLFVHGYAFDFGRACRRVSDLQVVLGDTSRVVLFSWPSAGNALVYEGDRETLAESVPALAATLRRLSAALGPERLAVVAHSMGAWGIMEALARLDDEDDGHLARDLVLLAPDYDADRFRERFPAIRDRFQRATLYTSARDVLLKLSSTVNDGLRLGQGGDDAVLLPGLETIDLSILPRHHPGAHEYHYYNPHVVADLAELLREREAAAERSATERRERNGLPYWTLRELGDER